MYKIIENKTNECIFSGEKEKGELFLYSLIRKYKSIEGIFSIVISGKSFEICKM